MSLELLKKAFPASNALRRNETTEKLWFSKTEIYASLGLNLRSWEVVISA